MARQGASKFLHKAKKSKSDEFYTQYVDIQKEVEAYLEYNPDTFRDKVVYCNCDDPYCGGPDDDDDPKSKCIDGMPPLRNDGSANDVSIPTFLLNY
ncbi:MAG: adenine-specific methyltransferase EcoRI family protein, partial [Cyclonatronaceae bacterium]